MPRSRAQHGTEPSSPTPRAPRQPSERRVNFLAAARFRGARTRSTTRAQRMCIATRPATTRRAKAVLAEARGTVGEAAEVSLDGSTGGVFVWRFRARPPAAD